MRSNKNKGKICKNCKRPSVYNTFLFGTETKQICLSCGYEGNKEKIGGNNLE